MKEKSVNERKCDESKIICLYILFISLSKDRKKDNEFSSICIYSRKTKGWYELCVASFVILKIQLRGQSALV